MVRVLLIAIALGFLGLFLVLPLATVFTEAFENGTAAYLDAIREPDALAALRLTLLAAAIAVPANLVFGVCAGWAIARFQFPGKQLLTTLIDRQGKIRVQYLGYRFDEDEFRHDLESLAHEP